VTDSFRKWAQAYAAFADFLLTFTATFGGGFLLSLAFSLAPNSDSTQQDDLRREPTTEMMVSLPEIIRHEAEVDRSCNITPP
jgi:hypothetical protein